MTKTSHILIAALAALAWSTSLHAQTMSFSSAKRVLKEIDAANPVERYCGCRYEAGQADITACGADAAKWRNRLRRIEYEHVVPAADFGRQRACWRSAPEGTSPRDHCRRADETFKAMEGDPFNLHPALGTLNAHRSDYRYGEVQGEPREFGRCDFEMSAPGSGRFIEPPEDFKGDAARVYFYFEARYGHRIGRSQRRLFEAWDKQDPVSEWERTRARMIFERTGMKNSILND